MSVTGSRGVLLLTRSIGASPIRVPLHRLGCD